MGLEYAGKRRIARIGNGATCAKVLEGYVLGLKDDQTGLARKLQAGDPEACTAEAVILRPSHGKFWLTWCVEGHLMLTTAGGAIKETLELSESLYWG